MLVRYEIRREMGRQRVSKYRIQAEKEECKDWDGWCGESERIVEQSRTRNKIFKDLYNKSPE